MEKLFISQAERLLGIGTQRPLHEIKSAPPKHAPIMGRLKTVNKTVSLI